MSNRGRKKIVYNDEVIIDIVKVYIEECNHNGLLKYKDLYEYSIELFNQNKIMIKLSDDFWRKEGRQGRKIVDALNESYSEINHISKIDNVEVVDTEKIVNQYLGKEVSNVSQMVHQLKKNEIYARKYQRVLKNNKNYEAEIKSLEYRVKQLTQRSEQLETALFSLFSSSKNEQSVKSLLNTGKSRSKYVDELFKNIFNDEVDLYSILLKKFTNTEVNLDAKKDNRVSNLVNLYNKKN
ncbi:hypothetical protein [Viridibacillus arvi]|uniref:hypothetical protein n=1 Tax=Viridibacillus arvi TaxID=263475 RepID=UPI003D0237F5